MQRGTLTFSGWGEPVQIDVPAPADVDATPDIDEDDVAAFTSFALLAPQSLPEGFLLQAATVEPEDAEVETCETVNLSYAPPMESGTFRDAGLSLLDVNLTSASCPWTESTGYYGEEGPGQPIQVGAHAAQLHREEDGYFGGEGEPAVHVRLVVGQTRIDAYSNLPQDRLVAALASLGPFDLASQPVESLPPPPGG